MKIQLVILALFVIGTLAHSRWEDENGNQIGRRRHYRGRRRNDNQIAANAEDAELEDSVQSEDEIVTTERSHRRGGCGSRKGGKRGERKGARRPEDDDEIDVRHGGESGESRRHSHHDADWHEKHGVPMPERDSDARKHHRHHKHHHHHHNRTTTTTTTSTPSSTDNYANQAEDAEIIDNDP